MAFVYVKHVINTPQTSLFTCRNCVFIQGLAECFKQRGTETLNSSVYLQSHKHDNTNSYSYKAPVTYSVIKKKSQLYFYFFLVLRESFGLLYNFYLRGIKRLGHLVDM